MTWKIKQLSNTKLKNPIMIEGLPGIGNVGKLAMDFIIDTLDAKKMYQINSVHFPSCVFINEENIVELPKIEIYHKKLKNNDLFLVSGDAQPMEERACYELCDNLLNLFEKQKGKEIITLGGIGLPINPKVPRIYCTGTNKKIIQKYSGEGIINNIYGSVGPIIGVSGLLLGIAKQKNMEGVSLLAETFGHPTYLGIRGAREIIKVLNKKLDLKLNINKIDKEIETIENEINGRSKNLKDMPKPKIRLPSKMTDYIG